MSKKINAPPVWREEITQYLDVLKAGGQSKGTLTTRRCQLSQMARDLQGVPADVSDDALVSWFARHEWKPETRKSYRNAVTGFFSWLHTTGRAAERTMIRLAAEAGLRRAEIAAVHSRDVMRDLVGRSLIVRGKGDKQRIVPISDELADTITAADGYVFPGRWSGHAEASYIGKHLSRLLGDGWTPHSLRHRYATATYRATNNLFLVSKLLGHDSVETTQRYVAMPEDRLRAALDDVALVI